MLIKYKNVLRQSPIILPRPTHILHSLLGYEYLHEISNITQRRLNGKTISLYVPAVAIR